MKKYKSLASIATAALLTITLVGGASAADWTTYQGNNNHTGIITDAVPLKQDAPSPYKLEGNGGGVNTVPVMQTLSGGDTYGYVLHNGGSVTGNTGGARLAKIKANGTTQIWSKQLTLTAGFQLSSPLLLQGNNLASEADDAIYVGTTGFAQVLQNDELTGAAVANWTVNGGTADGEAIVLTGTQDTTLSQTGVTLNTTAANRAALGIWVGNTTNPGVAINVTVKVDGVEKVKKSFPATTTAIEDKANKGNYYYYVNENFAATTGSKVTFDVDVVSGNKDKVKVDYASLYQQTGSIQKVTNLQESSPSNVTVVSGITGQINTPITTDGTYLYFGTWTGGTTAGTYYQVKISDNSVKKFTPESYGFYWAGATVSNGNVYFGSDNGKLYYRSVSDFANTGGVYDLATDGGVTPGNVRSSILADGTNLYFTSQGGYLWHYQIDSRTKKAKYSSKVELKNKQDVRVTSTSTPTKTDNYIYVGYYGGFDSGGIIQIDKAATTLVKAEGVGAVQSSVIAKSNGTTDYIYFTTNASTGGGYGYVVNGQDFTELWTSAGATGNFTLQGMAASNGYVMFGNDANNIYVVK